MEKLTNIFANVTISVKFMEQKTFLTVYGYIIGICGKPFIIANTFGSKYLNDSNLKRKEEARW
jgi:hypothetical protein